MVNNSELEWHLTPQSSNVEMVAWEEAFSFEKTAEGEYEGRILDVGRLHVIFNAIHCPGRRQYCYDGVPHEKFKELIEGRGYGGSVGKYLNAEIKKAGYPVTGPF